ncbi:MAG: hypothetical protein J5950_06545 [Clostridia bacterium]|nr:hypothetical protein [Clostridia bacterium]
MTIKSVYIYGFGALSDYSCTLKAGLNCIAGDNEAKKDSLCAFIAASFCGFSGESDADEAGTDAKTPSVLPSRRSTRPYGDAPFGGELKFTEGGTEYIISSKWGETREEDIVTLITVGGAPEMLDPGTAVCEKLWNITPDQAASMLSMPSDGRDAATLLKTLASLPEKDVWFGPAGPADVSDAEETAKQSKDRQPADADPASVLRRAANRLRNESKTGVLDMAEAHLEDLKEELNAVDSLEARAAELGTALKDAEKEKNELARKAKNDLDVEQIRHLAGQYSDFERAAAIRSDTAELQEEIIDEEKYVKRGQRPWLVLLWILAVLDVTVLVILTVYPVKIQWLGKILTAISSWRFPILIGAAVLFVLLVILIAAVSGSGMRRLTLLKNDMEFRKRQLSELLTSKETELLFAAEQSKAANETDGAEKSSASIRAAADDWLDPELRDSLSYWDNPDESEFFDAADKALGLFSGKAEAAKQSISGAGGSFGAVSVRRAKNAEASDKYVSLAAELSACEDQLKLLRPYPVIEEKCAELEGLIARGNEQLKALELAGAMIGGKVSANALYADCGADPGKIALCADEILKTLTDGKRSGVRISPEMVPYIDDNGSSRGLGSFSGQAAGQILLSIKLAQLSLALSAENRPAKGFSAFAQLGQALSRFDAENSARAISCAKLLSAGSENVQILLETTAAGNAAGNIITI